MLEMGEPVRIADLAKNLLRLAGLDNRGGGRIVYTGLRPGERLHETLVAPEEQTQATAIPRVRLVLTNGNCGAMVSDSLKQWERAFRDGGDDTVFGSLRDLFPGLDGGTLISQAVQGHASMQNLTAAP